MTAHRLANLTYQWGGDTQLVTRVAEGGHFDEPADVAFFVEARTADNQPLDIARILGRRWDVSQDTTSAATAGSVIATQRTRARIRWSLLRLLSRAGHKVQDRFLRAGAIRSTRHGRWGRVAVVHFPLASTGRQEQAIAKLRRWVRRQRRLGKRWMVAGDFNMPVAELARILGAPHFYGEDVMGFIWSEGWGPVDTYATHMDGTDHAVLTLTTEENR